MSMCARVCVYVSEHVCMGVYVYVSVYTWVCVRV